MCSLFLLENLKGRDLTEDLAMNWKVILKWILDKHDRKMWTGFIWLKIETSGGLL
jgi:hypothetical protein